ncbi:MAG: Ig-like domain-containing protein [Bacteroidota bacterium]
MNTINKITGLFVILFVSIISVQAQQVTGLDDYEIFIDPGHAQRENMGLYNYSEAEEVLRVGLEMKAMFENQTDIKAVHMSRLTDDDYITLNGRSDLANSLGADFFYSIHSNAGIANNVFTMYGGWKKNGVVIEKTPHGGKAFGDILAFDVAGAMRLPLHGMGNYPDRVFYYPGDDTHTNQWPYLSVNRRTNMASILSETGSHENPGQQQRNVNATWKKLQALAGFRSFLEYKELDRPAIGVVSGYIKDEKTGDLLNGITVTIGDKSYTTDTYESLFHRHTNNPDLMHNGFYLIEDLTPGDTVEVVFTSDSYVTRTDTIVLDSNPNGSTAENITFLDVKLKNSIPATVTNIEVEGGLNNVNPGTPIYLTFSREMDTTSMKEAISIEPVDSLSFSWEDELTLKIRTDSLDYITEYVISINDSIAKDFDLGQWFDGDGDGVPGGAYQFNITTLEEDLTPPVIIDYSPTEIDTSREIRPVIRAVFDEEIAESSITDSSFVVTGLNGSKEVNGIKEHILVGKQSVFHFFPTEDLTDGESYKVAIKSLKDLNGNIIEPTDFTFVVDEMLIETLTYIDNFESSINGWKQPKNSLNTVGVVRDETYCEHEDQIVCKVAGESGSMKMSYKWVDGYNNPYIREMLSSTSAQATRRFNKENILQMFVFGDGSGNQFRYMIKDGDGDLEASRWYTADWKGWKLISWDLTNDTVVAYSSGNGVLEGSFFKIEGIHMTHPATADLAGALYFDGLRFIKKQTPVAAQIIQSDNDITVYPNPARNTIKIEAIKNIRSVAIYNLSGQFIQKEDINRPESIIDIAHLETGVYFVKIETALGTKTSKLHVIK